MTTVIPYVQADPARRAIRWFAATRVGDWLFANVLRRLDGPVYRITSGRHTAANLLSGLPVVQLTTTGARTGQLRTVPVLGIPTTTGRAVFASNFGRRQQPGWYYNLLAHPGATVTVRGRSTQVHAVEVGGDVRGRLWREGLEIFPGWAAYQNRASGRDIAVFLLVPDEPAPAGPLSASHGANEPD